MEYAMACRKRSRKERDEEARILWWVEARIARAHVTRCCCFAFRTPIGIRLSRAGFSANLVGTIPDHEGIT